ncbi:hypothetical protein MMC07_001086 [Pseudocyphellaria aurata]|nr:hypothetical protein [Pseudocyphellaria aurata]
MNAPGQKPTNLMDYAHQCQQIYREMVETNKAEAAAERFAKRRAAKSAAAPANFCQVCDAGYSTLASLNSHVRKQNPTVWTGYSASPELPADSMSLCPLLPAPGPLFSDGIVDAQVIAQAPLHSTSQASVHEKIKFHFFLENEFQGAVPKSWKDCDTAGNFFCAAEEAWGAFVEDQPQEHSFFQEALVPSDKKPLLIAIRVLLKDFGRPIIVMWKNEESFLCMMEMVLDHATRNEVDIDIDVHCYCKRR